MWDENWAKLTEKDKEDFMRVVNLLLARTYVLRDQYDSQTNSLVINRDYRFVERHYGLISEYLRLAGWQLQNDIYLGVIAAYNRYGTNRYRLDKSTTYFLYTLRLIYEEQREKLNLAKYAITTVGELVEKMYNLGLVDRKPADLVMRESLNTLKRFQIIERMGGDWIQPDTRIIVYSSILMLVTNERIANVFSHLCDKGDEDETIEEDALN